MKKVFGAIFFLFGVLDLSHGLSLIIQQQKNGIGVLSIGVIFLIIGGFLIFSKKMHFKV